MRAGIVISMLAVLIPSSVPGGGFFAARSPASPPSQGIVLTEVERGRAGDRAGLREGDVLLSWSWKPTQPSEKGRAGAIATLWDLVALENSLVADGKVVVKGSRQGKPLEVALVEGMPGVSIRPCFDDATLKKYEEALGGDKGSAASPALDTLADSLLQHGEASNSVWLRVKAAGSLARAKKVDEARRAVEKALSDSRGRLSPEACAELRTEVSSLFDALGDRDSASRLLREAADIWKTVSPGTGYGGALFFLAEAAFGQGALDEAMEGFMKSQSVLEAAAPESYLSARTASRIGEVYWAKGDLVHAEEFFQRGFDKMERIAPQGAEMLGFANNLGKVAYQRGDLARAEAIYRKGAEVLEKNEPGSLALARSLNGLGLIVTDRGDLPEAERILARAVGIWKAVAPDNPTGWRPYASLGNVYLLRGDLAQAEACYQAVLEMVRRTAPGSLQETTPLGNLAAVALARRDYDTGELYLRQVLERTQKKAPDSPDLARCYDYLAGLEEERDRPDAALGYFRQSAAILRSKAPGSVQLARSLRAQAGVALRANRPQEALPLLDEALSIFEKINPESPDTAITNTKLGAAAQAKGDLEGALARLTRAVRLLDRVGIDSPDLAEALHFFSRVCRAEGKKAEARAHMQRALSVVESLSQRLGGSSQDQATFLEGYADFYREYEDLLLELGEQREAFRTVERWRAAQFLRMLAERDLDLTRDIPSEIERERRLAAADLERVLASLSGDKPSAAEETAGMEVRLRAAQKRLEDVRLKTLEASKSVYELRYPHSLSADEALDSLEEGTLLLEYSVGPKKACVYALGPGPREFSALALSTDGPSLSQDVRRFRALIRDGAALGASTDERELRALSSKLSAVLLGPVSDRLARARRLLVVPDGALFYLPFSALADPERGKRRARSAGKAGFTYLAEAKPVHTAASASVYAQLLKRRMPPGEGTLEAFGDPDYGKGPPAGHWRGGDLAPLPATRREVEAVRETLGAGRTYLGAEATAFRALEIPKDTRMVHFACHGFTDEERPLESALALAPGGGMAGEEEDGILRGWKIYESLRVNADLVTLSACETGLGRVFDGEGLVGLTRAFQYAGAQSVLASLWRVSDESTAELMRSFYAHLKAGASKDEALRAAQLELLRGRPDGGKGTSAAAGATAPYASPFHWAAFQLVGDWK